MNKIDRLRHILKRLGSVLVAFSGGADSSFLLFIAHECLGKNVLAVTADSPTYPRAELREARRFCRRYGMRHRIIRTGECGDKRFTLNPRNRCYFCKQELFRRLKTIAEREGIAHVVDASNTTDTADLRPGTRAKDEAGVRSPLQLAGMSKADIRRYSRLLRLPCWNKPAQACLASRIPFGVTITGPLLRRIERAERCVAAAGARQVRVRHGNGCCRIETDPESFARIVRRRKHIVYTLRRLGYRQVTLDLAGYRTGSIHEVK